MSSTSDVVIRHLHMAGRFLGTPAPIMSASQDIADKNTGAWGMDIVSTSPLFSTTPLFQNFHINHSFFKIFIIIRFSSFDNISRRYTS